MTDLTESVQCHSVDVDEVNKKLETIDRRVEEIKLDEITEDSDTKTKKKLADLEHCSHRNNLRLMGFKKKSVKHIRKLKAS